LKKKSKLGLKRGKARTKLNIPIDTPINELLMRLNALGDGKLTNASVLLSGKEPKIFFASRSEMCLF